MACLARWVGVLVVLCALACGDDQVADMDGDDSDGPAGSGDGDGDTRDDGADDVFRFAGDSGAGEGTDAALTDDTGSSGTELPEPVVGDGWLRFQEVEPSEEGAVRLDVDVPAGADSMVLTLDPRTLPRSLALVALTAPDGELLYDFRDEETEFPYQPTSLRNANDHLPYSFMFPTNPQMRLQSGTYGVLLFVDDPSEPVDVDVVFQQLPGGDAEPRLGIVLWFADGTTMDAAQARDDVDFQDAVDGMVGIFRSAGIRIDEVEYGNLGAGDETLATVEGDADLAELIAELRGDSAQVLHVIFVEHMENEAGNTIRTRTSGAPGPPAHPSFARRGAAVIALDTLPSSIRRMGEVLAHEAAHYLGLAHTTEIDGSHDPIVDTAECPADLASETLPSGEEVLVPADCSDHDGYNLMFYRPPLGSMDQRELTNGQAVIMAVNPMVRWVEP